MVVEVRALKGVAHSDRSLVKAVLHQKARHRTLNLRSESWVAELVKGGQNELSSRQHFSQELPSRLG